MTLILKWIRPNHESYPKVWSIFKERDLNSDKLVEYQIQDVPESMFDDAIKHMIENYLTDEPITNSYNGVNDPDHVEDYSRAWRAMLTQKTPLICLKTNSNEIVGINMNYVLSKDDTFIEDIKKLNRSDITENLMHIFDIMYKDFNLFEKYNINEVLASFGLSVAREYRGRQIGQRLLQTRKLFGEAFDLKATHTLFSSNYSNSIADKVGFQVDVEHSYDELAEINPALKFSDINSTGVTLKTWVF